MASYEVTLTKQIYLPDAFSVYMTTNFPLFVGYALSGTVMTVNTSATLTNEQLATMTTLINGYVDPPYYLNYSNSVSLPLHSHYTSEEDLVQIDGLSVLQTFIFQGSDPNDTTILDGLKTIVEYNTPNVQNFVNTTSGNFTLQLFDITRNAQIAESVIDIGTEGITTQWNELAQSGSTVGNTIYKSHQMFGLMNRSTSYDCIWQLRASTSEPYFNVKINALQYLFYDYESNPNA